ncbi:AAA family ATPase [Spirosoma sp. KNUC1025]|uniref:AAA family ATPase n=1 Tax=Spirosoma sp. KNUC1025 TaxID=2894082 RepID=UPI00386E6D6B|nr:AAA family ATPase [Spirosoma sp. KNUC1025]
MQPVNGIKKNDLYQEVIKEMDFPKRQYSPSGQTDYSALLESARVRPSDVLAESTACLMVQNEEQSFIIATLGNLSTVTGQAKAKKTFAVSLATAAAVSSELILNRIKGTLPDDKRTVLLFDTEQSRQHVLQMLKRICRLCNLKEPANLHVYSLRAFSPDERLKAIDHALNNTLNVGLVVIDGIRDLAVDPILDSEQASRIVTQLLQWTEHLQIHIMCVLHQNKNDAHMRGHLGTELTNKSETVMRVSRDSQNREVSHVKGDYCRNREFEPFSFIIDEDGTPQMAQEGIHFSKRNNLGRGSNTQKATLPTFETMSTSIVYAILQRTFTEQEQLAYNQLKANIMDASRQVGQRLSDGRTRTFIEKLLLNGMLIKFRPEKAKWDFYKFDPDACP